MLEKQVQQTKIQMHGLLDFTSNFVIGVYVGMDNPSSLGKFETGSKTALPIFENFVKNAVKKSDARPFKVSEWNNNDGC